MIPWRTRLWVAWVLTCCPAEAADSDDLKRELEFLRQQNREMLQKLQQQDRLIKQINQKLSTLETASTEPRHPAPVPISSPAPTEANPVKRPLLGGLGKLHLSGEAGIALFHHQSEGQFPNAEMRVDEAKLFLETPVWEDIYFFTELNLTQRQDPSDRLNVGELYVDFENLSRFWNQDGQLGLRLGRLDIPFGEEYLTRDAIDNPLISNSLMDFWGVDEGLEAYGKIGGVHYVFAVQNGGHPSLRDSQPVALLSVDRHKVLQILVNLLNNSVQALESRSDDRRLTLRTSAPTPERVRIEVEDNGCGIAAQNLSSIFQHGFTTKSSGHGFGLHSGALAAIELGGSLKARSDGPGQGACFSLELPLSQAAVHQNQAA